MNQTVFFDVSKTYIIKSIFINLTKNSNDVPRAKRELCLWREQVKLTTPSHTELLVSFNAFFTNALLTFFFIIMVVPTCSFNQTGRKGRKLTSTSAHSILGTKMHSEYSPPPGKAPPPHPHQNLALLLCSPHPCGSLLKLVKELT